MNKLTKILLYVISIISFIGILIIYPKLPDTIPIQWSSNGEISSTGGKFMALILGLMPIAFLLMFKILPKIDPKGDNYKRYAKTYDIFQICLTLSVIAFNWISIFTALNYKTSIQTLIPVLMGILFIILGNYLPTVKANFFVGIKTPWTLANDTVWRKTHKVGGYFFIILGVVFLITPIIPKSIVTILNIALVFIGLFIITIYSFIIYKKETKEK